MQRPLAPEAAGFIGSHAALDGVDAVINVGSGLATSVADVARPRGAAFSASPRLVTGQYRVGDIRDRCAGITRLKELLDYRPRLGLAEGLQSFAAWVLAQPLSEDRLGAANAELSARRIGAGSFS